MRGLSESEMADAWSALPTELQDRVLSYLHLDQLIGELPVLRDASAPLYARQEGQAMLLGLYDKAPVFWSVNGTPSSFDQELLPADMERVSDALANAMHRLPVLDTLGIKQVVNGPLLRTPDACPLIGPVPGLPNVWLNTGYFAGIAQSFGVMSNKIEDPTALRAAIDVAINHKGPYLLDVLVDGIVS